MSPHRLVVAGPLALGLALAGVPISGSAAPSPDSGAEGGSAPTETPRSDRERATELAQDGRTKYWKGEYKRAIESFTAAYALLPDPNLLFNISAAYEKLGDYERALEYLARYEPHAPAEEKEAVMAKRDELQRARDQRDLKAEPKPEPEPERAPVQEDLNPLPGPAPRDHEPLMGVAGWTLLGVAVAGLGLGTGFGVSALSSSNRGAEECFSMGGELVCSESARAELNTAKRHAIVADVSFGVAILATAAVLTIVGVRMSRRKHVAHRARAPFRLQGLGAMVRF